MTKLFSFLFLIGFSIQVMGQNSCSTAQFIRDNKIKVNKAGSETWYKFRAKGSLLDFQGKLTQTDSTLEYAIYYDADCSRIESGSSEAKRSTVKGYYAMTEELWQKVIDDGICACGTCLSKMKIDVNKKLKVKQGGMYLLKVVSHGKPFEFSLNYEGVDVINPIQFDLKNPDISTLEVGMVYQMRELFFVPAKYVFLETSYPELNKLKTFLAQNKVLHVEVRGHVNGPANNDPVFYQELSDNRAKAVRDFLVSNGVEKKRINIKGMANKQMRFPSPVSEAEAIQNRRVEIVITAVE